MREMHASQARQRGPIHFVGPFRIHHGHATVRLTLALALALALALPNQDPIPDPDPDIRSNLNS